MSFRKTNRVVKLDDIDRSGAVQIRTRLNGGAVERYVQDFDQLPAISLFRVPDREHYLLADGFHRMEAADRLGHDTIKATVYEGTMNDAMEFAVIANLQHGQPLSADERSGAILRLQRLHPQWTHSMIAKTAGVAKSSVSQTLNQAKVQKEVLGKTGATGMRAGDLRSIHALPKKMWVPLIQASEKRGWDGSTVKLAVKNLKDPRVSAILKQDLIDGKADPLVSLKNGELAIPVATMKKVVAEATSTDITLQVLKLEEAMTKLELTAPTHVIHGLDHEARARVAMEWPKHLEFMEKVLEHATKRERPKAVV